MKILKLFFLIVFLFVSPVQADPTFEYTNFLSLEDTPNSYLGESGNCVAVNGTETGLEFATCGSGGTPGGSDTQVQFNDGGSFGGDSDFTWNKTTNSLTITSAYRFNDDSTPSTKLIAVDDQAAADTHGNPVLAVAGKGNGTAVGGSYTVRGGAADNIGTGGAVTIQGGQGGVTSGSGGGVDIMSGAPDGSGNSGRVSVITRDGTGTNKNGGDFLIELGAGTGSGTDGRTIFNAYSPSILVTDLNTSDADFNYSIDFDCTDTGSGTEDCDVSYKQQINGTLTEWLHADADGSIDFKRALTASGLITGNAGLKSTNGATSAGFLDLFEDTDDGSNKTRFIVPAMAADITYTLPPDDGDAGEQLQTDGSGNLTWEAAGAGGSTAWSSIGDAAADGSIDFVATEQDIIGQLDSAGKSMLTLTNQDADRANSTTILSLHDYDIDDAQGIFLDMVADQDSTPTSIFKFAQDGATYTKDLTVPTEAYDATGWNGDNTVPTKDAVRDKIETISGGSETVTPGVCMGRLTLTDGTPVTTSDVTNSDNLYFEPLNGEHCAVYDTAAWQWVNIGTGLTITNSGLSNDTNYDVFLDYNGGSAQLVLTAWTNGTTRATTITLQDGAYVQTGNTDFLYLGTVRTDSADNDFEDSETKRFVYNQYNQKPRLFLRKESTNSWTYDSTTWRSANNSTTNRAEVVVGLVGPLIKLSVINSANIVTGGDNGRTGIGEDSTTAPHTNLSYTVMPNTSNSLANICSLSTYPPLGYHFYQWIEKTGNFSDGMTFYGDDGGEMQAALFGEIII